MEVSLYCYYKEQKHNTQSLMGHRSEKLYNALEGTMQEDILLYYKCAAYGGSTYGCAAVLHTAVLHTAVLTLFPYTTLFRSESEERRVGKECKIGRAHV